MRTAKIILSNLKAVHGVQFVHVLSYHLHLQISEEKKGDHKMMASTHWKVERVLAIAMVGVMPAALFVQGPIMDFALSTTVLLHGFW